MVPFPSPASNTAYFGGNGYYFDDVEVWGNSTYIMPWSLRPASKPPKNWRWFDIFRPILRALPTLIPIKLCVPFAMKAFREGKISKGHQAATPVRIRFDDF